MKIDTEKSQFDVRGLEGALFIGKDSDSGKAAVKRMLTLNPVLTYGSIGAGLAAEQPATIPGAAVGDIVEACPSTDLGNTALGWCARVSAANTIQVKVVNNSAGALTPSAVAWRILVTGF